MRQPVRRTPLGEIDDYRWLTGPAGAAWLARAAELSGALATRLERLRRDLPTPRAALVLEQIELRHRARDKFAAAERMFFTPLSLEQATDQWLAAYKAQRLLPQRARAADLCSGIGGDLAALAARGVACGVERDPVHAHLAWANVRAACGDASGVAVQVGDAARFDVASVDAWHLDPDRRPQGRRTTRVEAHEPSAEAIDGLLEHNPRAAVKLAPASVCPPHWSEAAELEWVSRSRECRQLVAWFGAAATAPGRRRATRVGNAAEALATFVGLPHLGVPLAPRIEGFVFEPDPAVLAARLDGALAAEHGLAACADGVPYWTGPRAVFDPLIACFTVDEVLPLDIKRLKAHLRARAVGRLEIKVRGLDERPEALRRKLRPAGDAGATLLVTRVAGRGVAIVCRERGLRLEA